MAHDFSTLSSLFDVIESRKGGDPGASYVAGLLKDGKGKIARKLGEEAIESMVAALADGKEALVAEIRRSPVPSPGALGGLRRRARGRHGRAQAP